MSLLIESNPHREQIGEIVSELVLSLFPGIGLLDKAFELEGFCVVRGPDCLWGGDVREFHPVAGKFDGVIGGPPCQAFSALVNINIKRYGKQCVAPNLIPQFERVIRECQPQWFVMENVPRAPLPEIAGYSIQSEICDSQDFDSPQQRKRRISFGSIDGRKIVINRGQRRLFVEPTVTASAGGRRAVAVRDANGRVRGKQGDADWHRLRGRSLAEMCELQGLPGNFLEDAPFTEGGKRKMVANGVPIPLGRAIARAIKKAVLTYG
jgi:DNA (cytosine-5)-methyltransferase 1